MKKIFAVALMVLGITVWAGSTVDQGMPGKQGPWPVTGTVVVYSDGGTGSGTAGIDGGAVVTQPSSCKTGATYYKSTSVGVAAGNTPSAQVTNRLYIELCNSLQNSGNPMVKCRTDGTSPVMAVTNPGDVLGIGDCIRYYVPDTTVPSCIADSAATNVTSYECVPTR